MITDVCCTHLLETGQVVVTLTEKALSHEAVKNENDVSSSLEEDGIGHINVTDRRTAEVATRRAWAQHDLTIFGLCS
ncbi:hypothetical protein RRG08_012466 [Elysia crispata]|uniref:Uncharacterized protein n=1 Tax=Elysia crispata TaxID=231223 RepID=A0AAE1DRM1_9GAST|nr:hypothetical protein RRG08_012466 [Elysia crispata]